MEWFFKISSEDGKSLTEKTGVNSLRVKTLKQPLVKKEILFWYRKEDIPKPEKVINPAIYMYISSLEEVSPNKFLIVDNDKRVFNLELLYVKD